MGRRLAVRQERLRAPFDGHSHQQRFAAGQLAAALEARLPAADPGLVHLDLAREPAALRVDHRPPQLVEHQPGRLVVDPELLGELEGRDAGLEGGDEVGGGEPAGQRQARAVENGPRGDRALVSADATLPQPATAQEPSGVGPACRTSETVRPAGLDQVAQACLVIREAALELAEVPRVVAQGARAHTRTLHVVAGGGNPISMRPQTTCCVPWLG